ncbi:SDR family oxidoreductase, partial [Candidatus Aerophobetes bacterium]
MVLVVGGAGYVGSMLVRELLNKGYAVRIFDKFYYGEKGIEDVKDRIEIIQGDMRSMDLSVLQEIDAVINVGGLSNDPTAEYNPRANYEMNVVATETLAKLSKKRGIKRFIFASSCSIYDLGFAGEDVVQDEEAKVNPKAAYSKSKYDAERILLKMVDEDFCPVILRKGTIFGFSYRMRYDLVVNTFVKDALTKGKITIFRGGEMWRPLVDISDVVKAYL